MGLGDRVKKTLKEWGEETADVLTSPLEKALAWGIDRLMDRWEPDLIALTKPTLEELKANPEVPADIRAVIDKITSGKKAAPVAILLGIGLAVVSGFLMGALSGGIAKARYAANKALRPSLLFGRDAAAAVFRGVADDAWFQDTLAKQGFTDDDIIRIKAINMELLSDRDATAAFLREKLTESDFQDKLKARGYSDEDIGVLKELAWIIPGAQDLIRMAVREVFSPDIVAKYGQMEDFPPDFAKWGEKVGLTEEWAKNYWAAHWELPSAGQGFEMMHRGVITNEDLKVLLRTLDVMPYWRDKLIQIAYSPYTRVDVRRMHKLGILKRDEVKKAYMDLGFDEEKAENMTKFTEEYNKDPEASEKTPTDTRQEKNRDLTTAQIVTGYRKGLFTEEEARASLGELAYDPDEIDYYISMEDFNREQQRKTEYVSNYRQLFVTGIINRSQVRSDLTGLNVPDGEIDQLLEVWELERLRRVERPSRADLDRFLKNGIIDESTWEDEMRGLGYSDRYIPWYLAYLRR